MNIAQLYPTLEHARAAEVVTEHFSTRSGVEAVLLTCSCARGKAVPGSCLDIAILLHTERYHERKAELEAEWAEAERGVSVIEEMRRHGPFAGLDIDFTDGAYLPEHYYHGWCSGPDNFELEVGNVIAYSVPLYERGDLFQRLREKWLPYYGEKLRQERLAMACRFGFNNLEHIPIYIERGLYFQAFTRLYHAFGEFLQGLFISRRVYAVAYDKWIKDQMVELLDLPELYPRLTSLFEIQQFESPEIAEKGRELWAMMEEYVVM